MIRKEKIQNGRAMDMGCGAGQLIPILSKLDYQVYGIDISKKMIEISLNRCKEFNIPAKLEVGDCEKIEYPDNYFDLYVAMGVIEYMSNDTKMIAEIKRLLKPGGIGIITLRNKRCIHVKWNTIYLKKYRHYLRNTAKRILRKQTSVYNAISRQHDPLSFKKLLESCSFKVIEEKYCHYHALPLPISIWLNFLHAVIGKSMEMYCPKILSPILASTYIVKFLNSDHNVI